MSTDWIGASQSSPMLVSWSNSPPRWPVITGESGTPGAVTIFVGSRFYGRSAVAGGLRAPEDGEDLGEHVALVGQQRGLFVLDAGELLQEFRAGLLYLLTLPHCQGLGAVVDVLGLGEAFQCGDPASELFVGALLTSSPA